MKTVFTECNKCEKDIMVGETYETISWQEEEVQSEFSVHPIQAESIVNLCAVCASSVDLKKVTLELVMNSL